MKLYDKNSILTNNNYYYYWIYYNYFETKHWQMKCDIVTTKRIKITNYI